jgi:hypothetical protein
MKTFAFGTLKGRKPRQETERQMARVEKEELISAREAKKARSPYPTTPVIPAIPLIPSMKL